MKRYKCREKQVAEWEKLRDRFLDLRESHRNQVMLLARATGASRGRASRWLDGRRIPVNRNLKKIREMIERLELEKGQLAVKAWRDIGSRPEDAWMMEDFDRRAGLSDLLYGFLAIARTPSDVYRPDHSPSSDLSHCSTIRWASRRRYSIRGFTCR